MYESLGQLLRDLLPDPGTVPEIPGQTGALAWFVFAVQWSAIILSALAGIYAARKNGLDFFGSLVIAFVVCVGGGTIRDLLLGRLPVFWLEQPIYPITVLFVTAVTMPIIHRAERGQKMALKIARPFSEMVSDRSILFLTTDALALGLWAYLGTLYGLRSGVSPVVAPILGVVTASFGGVLRDIFFARVPEHFKPGQLYAMAAAAGSIAYAILWWFGYRTLVGFLVCLGLTFVVRVASIRFDIRSN